MEMQAIQGILSAFVDVASKLHHPVMIVVFVLGVGSRMLVYWTVRRQEWFAREFEKRVGRQLESEVREKRVSFYVMSKRLLERTFYELFETRDRLKRRKPDAIMSLSDRFFLIRWGCAWIVRDTLKQLRTLRFGENPNFLNITKSTFHKNPAFHRVFGLIPISGFNDLLNLLPSLFVIGGIFGTFLGVMTGLKDLTTMNLSDPEATKSIMDAFLLQISFSMGASMMGIFFSVCMSLANTFFNPERLFVAVVDRFENSLSLLWNHCDNNEVPSNLKNFDEHRDAVEALAEASLNTEIERHKDTRDLGTGGDKSDKVS